MRASYQVKKFIEVSFLLHNKEVISKRIYGDLKRYTGDIILDALERLELTPIEVKSIGVEFVTVKRAVLPVSKRFVDSFLEKTISSSVEKVTL